MKRNIILLFTILFSGVAIISCKTEEIEKNLEEFAKFNINYTVEPAYSVTPTFLGLTDAAIPPGFDCTDTSAGINFSQPESQKKVKVNFQKDLDDNSIQLDDISSIKLKSISLDLVDSELGSVVSDFNFINNVALYLLEDAMNPVKLGELENIQDLNATSVSLKNLTEMNFKQYVDKNELLVGVEIQVNKVCKEPITVNTSLEFKVTPCISLSNSTADKECKKNQGN